MEKQLAQQEELRIRILLSCGGSRGDQEGL
jgi:hypothetical protein